MDATPIRVCYQACHHHPDFVHRCKEKLREKFECSPAERNEGNRWTRRRCAGIVAPNSEVGSQAFLSPGSELVNFADRVVLVTGASRGIGRVIAQEFARCGARVAVHYHRDRDAAEQTRATLPGGPHTIVQADLANAEAAEPLIGAVVRDLGRLDIVVNNAGIYEQHPIMEVDYLKWCDVWQRTLSTNLLGPAYVTYWAARHMVGQGGGRIVNVSSRGAFRGEPEMPAYGASKGGLNSMSQSLARALAPYNVFVYVVAPGWVETEMAAETLSSPAGDAIRKDSPLGRVARPEEVAYTVLFLASDGAEFLTGGIIDVNGASYLRS
jgi:NAD(P)-dependent dehydrogenase (short-subunit alcohol dehydrogenase family)